MTTNEKIRTPKEIDRGRLLFAGECEFLMGAVSLDTLPKANAVEVAFAGRSNVGKSSLLNALTGRKSLARTSNTPGRTQQLNYFYLGNREDFGLYLVDLPGYGFAKVPKDQVEAWTELVKDYLRGRPNLRRVLLLIDGRHGLKRNDKDIMKMLDVSAVSYQIVLTKLDKLKANDREKIIQKTSEDTKKFVACHPEVLTTSSEKKWGLEELRAEVATLALE